MLEWNGPVEPREWQPRAVEAALDAIRDGERPLISACTGSGKSAVLAWLARAAAVRGSVVVATPSQALVRQLAATIEAWCPGRVGTYFADAKDPRSITVVCNASLLDLPVPTDLRLLLIDEAHKSQAPAILAAVPRLAPRAICGVTATPHRTDERRLELFSRCVFRYSIADATRDGVLIPLRREWWDGSEADAADVDGVTHAMIRGAEGPGIVSATSIADAEAYSAYLVGHGFPAASIHSALPRGEGERRIRALLAGEFRALVHVAMLVEGVDIPPLRWLGLRRPVGSIVRLIQETGRILRASPGKTVATVYDVHDVLAALGLSHDAEVGANPAETLDELAEREANPEETISPIAILPPAAAVDELQQWARRALLSLVEAGVVDSPAGGSWRSGWATNRQISYLAKLSPVARWFPAGPRLAIRTAIDHGAHLTAGQASDLIELLRAAGDASGLARQRHGSNWPAVQRSIQARLGGMPAPPEDAVRALISETKRIAKAARVDARAARR